MKTPFTKAPRKKKSLVENGHFRANYFARYRFQLEELISYLKSASGFLYSEVPLAYQCLDDLGYWTLVRTDKKFVFTEQLESSLRHQFAHLQELSNYQVGELLIWAPLQNREGARQIVKVVEKVSEGEKTVYRIQIQGSEATLLVSHDELNYWNAAGSSMPIDELNETIDWDKDVFWLKRLNDFKEMMAHENFEFNFSLKGEEMEEQKFKLIQQIIQFFHLSEGSLVQRHRGLGFLACGQGDSNDNALVMSFVIQALGAMFGLQGRLWQRLGATGDREFQLRILSGKQSQEMLTSSFVMKDQTYQPYQRTINEVLRRLIAAGPFGQAESQNWVVPAQEDEKNSLLNEKDQTPGSN